MPKYLLGIFLGFNIFLSAQDSLMRFEYGSQVLKLKFITKKLLLYA